MYCSGVKLENGVAILRKSTPRKSFRVQPFGGFCTVEVGEDKKPFHIHKSMLTEHSEYFKRALSGTWEEAKTGVVTLADVEKLPFHIFVQWLYSSKIEDYSPEHIMEELDFNVINGNLDNDKAMNKWEVLLLKSSVLADRFMAFEFAQAAEDGFIDFIVKKDRTPCHEAIVYAYENLPQEGRLVQFIVERECQDGKIPDDTPEKQKLYSELPHEFLVQVMMRYSRNVRTMERECHADRTYKWHYHRKKEDRYHQKQVNGIGSETPRDGSSPVGRFMFL